MSYLFILKRFEIWLLLGVVVALLVFAFQPVPDAPDEAAPAPGQDGVMVLPEVSAKEPSAGDGGAPGDGPVPTDAAALTGLRITGVQVEPTGEGRIVAVTLLARAKSDGPVPVNEETLRASTGEGVPVPHFFTPFQVEQQIVPEEESLVTVTLWVADSAGSIWLDFQGDRAEAELPGEL